MMKIFRKYMKEMLAIFMSALLVVWLGGSALTSWLGSSGRALDESKGTVYGETVTTGQLQLFNNEAELLKNLGVVWEVAWRYAQVDALNVPNAQLAYRLLSQPLQSDSIRKTPLSLEEFYLLREAARRRGLYIPDSAVEQFKLNWNILPERIAAARERHRISLNDIDNAIRSFLVVQQDAVNAGSAVHVSEADIQNFIRKTNEQIEVEFLNVDARKFVDESYMPSEEELKAQFEEYKNEPAKPGSSMDFGYQLPKAAQVEYIKIDASKLIEHQRVTTEEAFAYWQQNKQEFRQPTTQPATQPGAPAPKGEAYETFSQAQPFVMEKLNEEKAKKEALRVGRDLINQLTKDWQDMPTTQPSGYREIPDSAQSDSLYTDMIDRVGNKYPGALNYHRTQMLEEMELRKLPIAGTASAGQGTQHRTMLFEAAFMVPGLDQNKEDDPARVRFYHNLYETVSEPFVDPTGDVYVMRTVDVRLPQAPADYTQVKEQLIEDIRMKRAYEQAGQVAEQLADAARGSSLSAALDADPAVKEKLGEKALIQPKPFTQEQMMNYGSMPQLFPSMIPQIGYDPELVNTAFELAAQADGQGSPITTYEQPNRGRWLVLQYKDSLPVTEDEYEQQRQSAQFLLNYTRMSEVFSTWFDTEQIFARTEWQPALPEEAEGNVPPTEETEGQAKTEQKDEGQEGA